jgi:hypothetical protein
VLNLFIFKALRAVGAKKRRFCGDMLAGPVVSAGGVQIEKIVDAAIMPDKLRALTEKANESQKRC